MRSRLLSVLGSVFVVVTHLSATAQVNVTASISAQQLAAKLAGPGVTVLNPTLSCPTQANGIFRVVTSNLGLDSGIVLTTGLAATDMGGIGINGGAYNLASKRNNAQGDPDLDPLAQQNTHDACSLEFDVIPQGDTVKFDYVFGSEEYINATCGPYNDAFAFFISGPGISGTQNMALVPGTNIPVTINSINSGTPGPGLSLSNCTSMGPGSPFTSYFINNNLGTSITYEGFTTVLQAKHAVTPCGTYHLKMTIADGGNFLYDSGVFIRAGSLQANTYKVEPVGGNALSSARPAVAKGCLPGKFRIRRPQAKATAETVKFIISGTAVNGYDYASIPDSVVIPAGQTMAEIIITGLPTSPNGPRSVQLLVKAPVNCTGTADIADSASLLLLDTFSVRVLTTDAVLCRGESVRLQAAGDSQLTYNWSPTLGLDSAGSLRPTATPFQSTNYKITASWPAYGCAPKSDSVSIRVLEVPRIDARDITDVCPHENIRLNAAITPVYNGYSYTWTGPNGFSSSAESPELRDVRRRFSGYYIVTVKLDTSRCTATDTLLLTVTGPDSPGVAPVIFCQGKPGSPLTASGSQLRWYTSPEGGTGSTTPPTPNTDRIGDQYYYVTQTIFDCESERSMLPVTIKTCCDRPVFIPTAFTPNNDGKNDQFAPRYSGFGYTTAKLKIYNRWGQMIFQAFDDKPWDGRAGNREAPSDTYFYDLTVNCQEGGDQHFTGDVLLIR